jgi:hypothetical protein
MNRRQALKLGAAALSLAVLPVRLSAGNMEVFDRIIAKAEENEWKFFPYGELVSLVGMEFTGTPYKGGTLEGDGPETCRVNLDGLDCVTFVEASFCIARIIIQGNPTWENFIEEVEFTRYRGGIMSGYTSRLHYTSEWFADNYEKGVFENVNDELNGNRVDFGLNFMSSHPQYYPALQRDSVEIFRMKKIEAKINEMEHLVIEKRRVPEIAPKLQNGDIIAFATTVDGLDYSHTGLIRYVVNKPHLLHASSDKNKVLLDVSLENYIAKKDKITGISVARPINPKTKTWKREMR